MTDLSRIADAAHDARVAVIGAGIGGLVAGYECAKLGMPVTVFEATDGVGGLARTVELGGASADLAASAFSAHPALDALIDELGLAADVVVEAETTCMTDVGGKLVPLPQGVLGIPANPFASDVVQVIGWGGAWRAYLDRLRPPLTIGHERDLAKLVGSRMGQRVCDRLVTPRTRGGFGMSPGEVDVDVAAPGLNAALTTQGSLSGAVAAVLDEMPARPLRSFRAGIGVLAEALAQRIRELGGAVRTDVRITEVAQVDGGIRVHGESSGASTDATAANQPNPDGPFAENFQAVFIATDQAHASALLAGATAGSATEPHGPLADVVSVLVRDAGDPRWGAGVLTAASEPRVWSIADESARWPQRQRPAGTRVLRAVLAHAGDAPDAASMVAELTRILGGLGDVLALRADTVRIPPQQARRGFAAHARGVRDATAAVAGLGAVGAWVAGSGIAAVVADAIDESERVRRTLLFGEATH